MTTLKNTEPHYVRCIKPNTAKAPRNFDGDMVAAQLRYAGMMETIRIRQVGFPIRYLFEDFYKRCSCLLSGSRLPASQWRYLGAYTRTTAHAHAPPHTHTHTHATF